MHVSLHKYESEIGWIEVVKLVELKLWNWLNWSCEIGWIEISYIGSPFDFSDGDKVGEASTKSRTSHLTEKQIKATEKLSNLLLNLSKPVS